MLVSGICTAVFLVMSISNTNSDPTTEHVRHECINKGPCTVSCSLGMVIMVNWAHLGRAAVDAPGSSPCALTIRSCSANTPVPADTCNWKKSCLIHPNTIKVDLAATCGAADYIILSYKCLLVSTMINICGASLEVTGIRYIVNDKFPAAVPGEPHECQCTIQRHPEATANWTVVTVVVWDARLHGGSCLTSDCPGYDSTYVCSRESRYKAHHLSENVKLRHSEERLKLTFEKQHKTVRNTSFFVVALIVSANVTVNCRKLSTPTTVSATTPAPRQTSTLTKGLEPTTNNTRMGLKSGSGEIDTGQPHMYIIIGVAVGAAVVVLIAVVVVIVAIRSRRKKVRQKPSVTSNPPITADARQRHSAYEGEESMPEAETALSTAAASSKPVKHYQPLDANHVQQPGASAGVYDEIKGNKVSDKESKKESACYNGVSRPIPADFNPMETYATVDKTKKKKKANNDNEGDIISNPYSEQDDNNAQPEIAAPSQGVDNFSMEPMYDAAVDVNPFAQNDEF